MDQSEHNPRDVLEQLTTYNAPLRWGPLPPAERTQDWGQDALRAQESLAYLHAHYVLPATVQQLDLGGGISGRISRLFAKLAMRSLGNRMSAEQAVLAHLVQMTEALAARCDEMANMVATRQVDEAANQARLAGWLDTTLSRDIPRDE
jgi:hypothetical protein